MRRNRVQAEIAEAYGVSQPTVSRAIPAITPLLMNVLLDFVPTADELDSRTCYIVDGTLLPCWSWAAHPELYSGKHKTTGMNVQAACTIDGRLAWISDPLPGSRHDNHCLGESGILAALDPQNWTGDKGWASRRTRTLMFRRVAGRPVLPRLDRAARRRRAMSRCQRKIVSGVTSSRSPFRRALGITLSRVASRARSALWGAKTVPPALTWSFTPLAGIR